MLPIVRDQFNNCWDIVFSSTGNSENIGKYIWHGRGYHEQQKANQVILDDADASTEGNVDTKMIS